MESYYASPLFGALNFEQKNVVDYIHRMASLKGTDISAWNLDAIFGEFKQTRQEINQIMFDQTFRAEIPVVDQTFVSPEMLESLKGLEDQLKRTVEDRKRLMLRQYQEGLERAHAEYRRYESRKNIAMRSYKEYLSMDGQSFDVVGEVQKLMQNNFWVNVRISPIISRNEPTNRMGIFADTKNPVHMSEVNPAAGIDTRVNLGKFTSFYDWESGCVKILPLENNLIGLRVRDDGSPDMNYHPYVGTSGGVCWGDNANEADNLCTQGKIGELFELISGLLITYAPGGYPYRGLGSFKTEFDQRAGGDGAPSNEGSSAVEQPEQPVEPRRCPHHSNETRCTECAHRPRPGTPVNPDGVCLHCRGAGCDTCARNCGICGERGCRGTCVACENCGERSCTGECYQCENCDDADCVGCD